MNSSKARKAYLVLTCGHASLQTSLPKGKGEDGEMCSDEDDSDDGNENATVSSSLYSVTFSVPLFTLPSANAPRFIAPFSIDYEIYKQKFLFDQ